MGLESLPTTELFDSSYAGLLGGALGGVIELVLWFLNLALFPVLILVVSLVLYYFTGDKKKADEFMPNLMSQIYRLFGYVWLTFIAFGAYVGISQSVNYLLTEILPEKETFRVVENDPINLVKGVMLTLLMALFAALIVMLNRRVVEVSKIGSTMSVKYFVGAGMILFSFILFVSSISFVNEFVAFLDDTDMGLPAANLTAVIVSGTFFGVYLMKGMKILKAEK